MRVRTPEAAVDDLLGRLRVPVSCLVARPLLATGYRVVSRPQYVSFAPPSEPVLLRLRSGARIAFTFRYDYEIVPTTDGWRRFETLGTGHWYEIGDADGREIMAFHWHPVGASPIGFPHLHLSSRIGAILLAGDRSINVGEMHIPTGAVTPVDIVRLLIAEFGVEPLRSDWESVVGSA